MRGGRGGAFVGDESGEYFGVADDDDKLNMAVLRAADELRTEIDGNDDDDDDDDGDGDDDAFVGFRTSTI
jgi:hypothetical protein